MMAMTTSNSINVNPRDAGFMGPPVSPPDGMCVRTGSKKLWSAAGLAGSRAREVRVLRRQAQEPRSQLMETGHDVVGSRSQLAPVLIRSTEMGSHERAREGLLGPLDAAPD